MGALENHQTFHACFNLFPVGIALGQVSLECAKTLALGARYDEKGDLGCIQTIRTLCNQGAKRVLSDQIMHDFNSIFCKNGRDEHDQCLR